MAPCAVRQNTFHSLVCPVQPQAVIKRDRWVFYLDFLSLLRGARQPRTQLVRTLTMSVKRCHLVFSLKNDIRELASYGQHYD